MYRQIILLGLLAFFFGIGNAQQPLSVGKGVTSAAGKSSVIAMLI